ncbi:hypothetical protein E2C01_101369 [Portunus trituberculatus]|uniref:Uncharacterized protein n=1 Tax=Portunus trituberculatus TaxID=210409 RepID=A0A5B7KFX8_PORTR|nr:hypothetical protein [Portunus trituberculatus]
MEVEAEEKEEEWSNDQNNHNNNDGAMLMIKAAILMIITMMRGDKREVGAGQVNVGEEYWYFLDELRRGQVGHIPCKTIKSQRNDPKWMTDRLKSYIGQKKNIYKGRKAGDETLWPLYSELVRTVKRLTRKAKSNYEFRVTSQAKTDPKGFFHLYKTKAEKK